MVSAVLAEATSTEVALLVADERLVGIPAVDFLARAHDLHPGAKRVLLTARGDWAAGLRTWGPERIVRVSDGSEVTSSVARDYQGFILTGQDLHRAGESHRWPLERPPLLLETSTPGVFAAGDVRHRSVNE